MVFKKKRKFTKEHKRKIGLARKGMKFPKKWRENIAKATNNKGSKNPNWKGGKRICNIRGSKYMLIYSPKHPLRIHNRYVYEHRLIMEKYLGRYLKSTEIVHHIDKNTLNNHISNLMLFPTNLAHLKHHRFLKKI